MHIKVMTFNLRVDIPQDGQNAWSYRKEKVPSLINKHLPLVIGTQEGMLQMIEDMMKGLLNYSWIGQGRRGGMKDEFCAIFYDHTQLKVVETGQFWLSEQPEVPNSISWESDFPRICTWGHFRFKKEPEKEFILYNTHLDHISQAARENGIYLIFQRLVEHYESTNLPMILTGDLNSMPDNPVVRFLKGEERLHEEKSDLQDSYTKMDGLLGKTFHAFDGGTDGEPIDYIFTTRNVKIQNTEVDRSTIEDGFPSDHYPVITSLQI